jgi:hypothetical protein
VNHEVWVVLKLFGEVISQNPGIVVVLVAEAPDRFVAQATAGDVVWRICMHKKKQVEKTWKSLELACSSLASVGIKRVVVEGRLKLDVEENK